jgi:hypothetical protein
MPMNNSAGKPNPRAPSHAAGSRQPHLIDEQSPEIPATSGWVRSCFISLRLRLAVARNVFIRTARRFRLRFRHALLTPVFAALVLHAFKVVFFGHRVRTCVAAGRFRIDTRARSWANAICGNSVPDSRSLAEPGRVARRTRAISRYFGAESFDNSAIASCTVVMNCAGKMIVEFLSTEISAIV